MHSMKSTVWAARARCERRLCMLDYGAFSSHTLCQDALNHLSIIIMLLTIPCSNAVRDLWVSLRKYGAQGEINEGEMQQHGL